MSKSTPWHAKAQRVIGRLSAQAWYSANHDKNGKRRKTHMPYSIPEEAQILVAALGDKDKDQSRGERTAKEVMELLRRRGVAID